MDNQQIARRIMKLLALADKAGSAHEAGSALAKAKELLQKYNICENEAALAAEGFKEQWHYYGVVQKPRWMDALVATISHAYSCGAYTNASEMGWIRRYHNQDVYAEALQRAMTNHRMYRPNGFVVYGFTTDVDVALHAYDAARHMVSRIALKESRKYPKHKQYQARMSFAEGIIYGLIDQLDSNPPVTYKSDGATQDNLPVPATSIEVIKRNRIEEYTKANLGFLMDATRRQHKTVDSAITGGYDVGLTLSIAPGVGSSDDDVLAIEQAKIGQ